MSESTRALCQIVEARPFLTLTDDELEMVVMALASETARRYGTASFISYSRLAEVVWQELKSRRANKPAASTASCPHFASTLGPPIRPIHCEGLHGHDGPHFATNGHDQRKEWR